MSIVLVDMDGVLVNWGEAYGRALDVIGEASVGIRRHADQRSFNLHDNVTPEQSVIINRVMSRLDYFDMLPIEGAQEGMKNLLAAGHDVFICTSPWVGNAECAKDKLRWVEHFLGAEWLKRAIITSDKTLVHGDWLIDDKPEIKGVRTPDWKQILFDQPYNQEVKHLSRMRHWDDLEARAL